MHFNTAGEIYKKKKSLWHQTSSGRLSFLSLESLEVPSLSPHTSFLEEHNYHTLFSVFDPPVESNFCTGIEFTLLTISTDLLHSSYPRTVESLRIQMPIFLNV